jgi:hypothetical protein
MMAIPDHLQAQGHTVLPRRRALHPPDAAGFVEGALNGARSHLAAGLTIDGHLTRDGQLENCASRALSACLGVNVDLARNGSLIAVPRIVIGRVAHQKV